jgi:Protein of unknown function (DUF616)
MSLSFVVQLYLFRLFYSPNAYMCGPFFTTFRFVKGRRPGQGTGFEIDESDLSAMENCYGMVVASAIFGIILL